LNIQEEIEKNFYIRGNFDLIQCTQNLEFETVFDVGCGKGGAALYFANKGKKVTTITLDEAHHQYNRELFNKLEIQVVKGDFIEYKTDEKFDAVWMSHSLEHTQNPGIFLQNAGNILKNRGWLFVLVPPFHPIVHSGHFSMGWNVGTLMYNLLASGFDVKNGHFIKYGNNICAFVQKQELNKYLNQSFINLSEAENDLPFKTGVSFCGDIDHINWFSDFLPKLKEDIAARKAFCEDESVFTEFYMNKIINNKGKINDFIQKNKQKKVVFYGAGIFARKIMENNDFSELNLLGFVDNSPHKKSQKIGNYEIYSLSDLKNLKPDIIVITAFKKLNIMDSLPKYGYIKQNNIEINAELFS